MKNRSSFLTILCVFTVLGSVLGLFDSLITLTQTEAVSATTRIKRTLTPEDTKNDPPAYFEDRASGDAPMPADPDVIRPLAGANIFYNLLTIIGAALMFNLRRAGFWVYCAGVLVGIVLPISLIGFSAINTTFGVFFSVIFGVLYWYCLPEMKRQPPTAEPPTP
jgi:hypothetical protein